MASPPTPCRAPAFAPPWPRLSCTHKLGRETTSSYLPPEARCPFVTYRMGSMARRKGDSEGRGPQGVRSRQVTTDTMGVALRTPPPPSWVELGHLVPQQWSRRTCSFPLGTKELSWRLHQVETSNQAWVLSLPSAGSQLYEGCVYRPQRLGPASSAWLLCALSQWLEQRGKHLRFRSCPA